jgi:hypothetical protein
LRTRALLLVLHLPLLHLPPLHLPPLHPPLLLTEPPQRKI